jgi:hypothetical protein
MPRRLDPVSTRVYRTKVQRAEAKSETYRTTIPQVVAQAILDLQKGDEIIWTVDTPTRRVTVTKGDSKRTDSRSTNSAGRS